MASRIANSTTLIDPLLIVMGSLTGGKGLSRSMGRPMGSMRLTGRSIFWLQRLGDGFVAAIGN
jgi:hypothetical protein